MSNEFVVHNFYNHSKEELVKIKAEFKSLWQQAYNFKKGHDDLPNHKTYKEWLEKWDNKCDDDLFYEVAEEYYTQEEMSDD